MNQTIYIATFIDESVLVPGSDTTTNICLTDLSKEVGFLENGPHLPSEGEKSKAELIEQLMVEDSEKSFGVLLKARLTIKGKTLVYEVHKLRA